MVRYKDVDYLKLRITYINHQGEYREVTCHDQQHFDANIWNLVVRNNNHPHQVLKETWVEV